MKKKKDFFERQDVHHEGNRDCGRHCKEELGSGQNHDGQGGRKVTIRFNIGQGIVDSEELSEAERIS